MSYTVLHSKYGFSRASVWYITQRLVLSISYHNSEKTKIALQFLLPAVSVPVVYIEFTGHHIIYTVTWEWRKKTKDTYIIRMIICGTNMSDWNWLNKWQSNFILRKYNIQLVSISWSVLRTDLECGYDPDLESNTKELKCGTDYY